ncbi:MAG: sensor histidine kinase [Oligoflexales bacterium]
MDKEITPKKTILFLTILLSITSYFGLDHHYRTRAKDVVFTIINSSGELIKVNNFMQFGGTIKFVMSREPFIKSVFLYDKDYRKLLNFGDEVDISTEFHNFNHEQIQILNRGPLAYTIKYVFNNDSDIIMVAYLHDDNRFLTLFIMVSVIFALFGIIYIVCQRLDFDNLNAQAAKHALDLMSCGFHEMKQTVELFRCLQENIVNGEVTFNNQNYEKMFVHDFNRNMISVDSMMSILKLTNKRAYQNNCETDLNQVIDACIETYRTKGKSIDIKFNHSTKLTLSNDILYATFGNLIKNAYTYSDGLIWIRTSEVSKYLVFTIANTGKEIPKEKQKAILKPGVALKGQTGLGLHICDMWCKKIGAKLSIESNHAATQFTIKIPLQQHVIQSIKKEVVEKKGNLSYLKTRTTKKVAVIDDVETFRVSICKQIARYGCSAENFENMDIFLDNLKNDPSQFNYILIDRHGNGFDAVKDRFPDSCRYYGYQGKIILYSSDIPDVSQEELKLKGFDFAVKKGQQINWVQFLQ